MKVVTAEEMQAIDREAIEEVGIPSLELMERAGQQVVAVMMERYAPITSRRVLVVCGRGNNGGDGLVVARLLLQAGCHVEVIILAKPDTLSEDANTNYLRLKELPNHRIYESPDEEGLDKLTSCLEHCDLIVDAVFGTGLSSPARGVYEKAIGLMNSSGKAIVAVDIPSGLSADTGKLIGEHVRADCTITFGLPKLAHVLYPAARYVGELVVADIGFPPEVIEKSPATLSLIMPEDIRRAFPPRDPEAHKGTYGHLLIISGSVGKAGACVLACQGALRAGAGLVTAAVARSILQEVSSGTVEAMTIPLPETSEGTIAHKAMEVLGKELGRFSSLALGPGLTTHPETVDFVKDLLRLVKVPIVIDADGCNALALLSPKVLEATSGTVCLTPHPGEMARLLGSSTAEVQSDRLVAALEAARRFGAITVLKGARTLIASPDGEVSINLTGNPGMASGGVGDVLTGLIGGLLARGLTPLDACRAGVYLHGFAGDLASKTVGEIALTASDLLKALPQAIHQVVEAQTAPPLPFCLR